MAHHSHIVRVTAEGPNVTLYPTQGLDLVEQTQIAATCIFLTVGQRRQIQKAQQAQTVVERNKDHLGMCLDKGFAPVAGIGRAVAYVGTAVDPHHYGATRRAHTVGRCPHVKCQAVLALGIERGGIVLRTELDCAVAKIFGLAHQAAVGFRLGDLPAPFTCGLHSIGDALEGQQRPLTLSHKDTVSGFDSQ